MTQKLENPFPQKELPVLITVDVCDGSFDQGERKSRFKDLMELLPGIRDLLGEVVSEKVGGAGGVPVTWFVRADMQVKEITGNAMGLFHGWKDFWDSIEASGGETGWHPHLYKRHGSKWIPIRDPSKLRAEADKIWHEMSGTLWSEGSRWKPVSSRMGESVSSNELMRFLDRIGIIVDSSALPGRVRDDGLRWFDWESTPESLYYPSTGDYRRPSRAHGSGDRVDGEEPLSILQVPFTMRGIQAPYDPDNAPLKRYIDLSFAPELLSKSLGMFFNDAEYVMMVVHPMQAAGREIPSGGLVAGGLDVVRKNLGTILGSVQAANRIPRLMTVGEFARNWLGDEAVETKQSEEEKPKEKREKRDSKTKGGTQRTLLERSKAAKLTTKGGKAWQRGRDRGKGPGRPPRRGPRGR